MSSLATWSGAHVEYRMVRFDITQEWWKHAYNLLARDQARLVAALEQVVNSLQVFVLLEKFLWYGHLVDKIQRIESLAIHLELRIIWHEAA